MTASGTAGHAGELGAYGPLDELGAVVVKSLSPDPWQGNPAPRLAPISVGMINSVGLQGPGVKRWAAEDLPALAATGATVVVSIWGRSTEDYARAGEMLRGVDVAAVEVNVSCPNLEDQSRMFAHSAEATAAAVSAIGDEHPRWVKLSPNVADLTPIAAAAIDAGASALVLTNTLLGMKLDLSTRRPVLGNGGGGLSGPAVHPVAVRAVYEIRKAFPDVPIIGVGGVMHGRDALEFLIAGANAVQVGTATFHNPRAPWKVTASLERALRRANFTSVADAIGAAQR